AAMKQSEQKQKARPMIWGRGIEKEFQLGEQWIQALHGIDLEIPEGQFIAIMGPSGSGKSTLLYLLGGLDHPTGGQIVVGDYRLDQMQSEARARFRRETIGFIFQAFHLIP